MALTATPVAPLYGPQGPLGVSNRTGSGAPTSGTTASDGDTFTDATNAVQYEARSGGTWPGAGQSLIGPTGPTGLSGNSVPAVGQFSYISAPFAVSGGVATLSNTPTALGVTAGDTSQAYVMQAMGYFIRASADVSPSGTASVAVSLVDTNTGTSYATATTASSSSGSTINMSTPSIQATPIPAGANLVWQATGSGTAAVVVNATYLVPATVGVAAKGMPGGYLSANAAQSSAGLPMLVPGAASLISYSSIPSTGYLSAVMLTNGTTAAATFSLVSTASNSVVYTSASVPAGGDVQTYDLDPSVCPIIPNQLYFWRMASSGTSNTASHAGWKVAF